MKDLHIICGKCGNNENITFKIDLYGACNLDGEEVPAVFISCPNCINLTNLSTVLEEK